MQIVAQHNAITITADRITPLAAALALAKLPRVRFWWEQHQPSLALVHPVFDCNRPTSLGRRQIKSAAPFFDFRTSRA
jgi:hypothetical protein